MVPRITSANAKSWLAAVFSRRATLAAVAATIMLALPPLAPTASATTRPLNDPEAVGEINRIQDYLNGIRTMESRFIQVNPDGSAWDGKLYVKRPGRFRFQYDPPVPYLLVANGMWLFHVDRALKETNVIPLVKTPAQFLVQANISLRKDFKITKLEELPGILRIGLVTRDNPDMGEVTLTFSEKPLELRKWTVKDVQNNITQVTLENTRYGVNLNADLFKYVEQPVTGRPE